MAIVKVTENKVIVRTTEKVVAVVKEGMQGPAGASIPAGINDKDTIRWNASAEAWEVSTASSSEPPTGHYKVVNFYVNSGTGKLVVEYEDNPI